MGSLTTNHNSLKYLFTYMSSKAVHKYGESQVYLTALVISKMENPTTNELTPILMNLVTKIMRRVNTEVERFLDEAEENRKESWKAEANKCRSKRSRQRIKEAQE